MTVKAKSPHSGMSASRRSTSAIFSSDWRVRSPLDGFLSALRQPRVPSTCGTCGTGRTKWNAVETGVDSVDSLECEKNTLRFLKNWDLRPLRLLRGSPHWKLRRCPQAISTGMRDIFRRTYTNSPSRNHHTYPHLARLTVISIRNNSEALITECNANFCPVRNGNYWAK